MASKPAGTGSLLLRNISMCYIKPLVRDSTNREFYTAHFYRDNEDNQQKQEAETINLEIASRSKTNGTIIAKHPAGQVVFYLTGDTLEFGNLTLQMANERDDNSMSVIKFDKVYGSNGALELETLYGKSTDGYPSNLVISTSPEATTYLLAASSYIHDDCKMRIMFQTDTQRAKTVCVHLALALINGIRNYSLDKGLDQIKLRKPQTGTGVPPISNSGIPNRLTTNFYDSEPRKQEIAQPPSSWILQDFHQHPGKVLKHYKVFSDLHNCSITLANPAERPQTYIYDVVSDLKQPPIFQIKVQLNGMAVAYLNDKEILFTTDDVRENTMQVYSDSRGPSVMLFGFVDEDVSILSGSKIPLFDVEQRRAYKLYHLHKYNYKNTSADVAYDEYIARLSVSFTGLCSTLDKILVLAFAVKLFHARITQI